MRIPDAMRQAGQWVAWRYEQRDGGKPTKIPYNATPPLNLRRASSTDPATWTDYETAVQALKTGHYEGIGFVFTPPFVGIDFDNCFDDNGVLDPVVAKIVARFDDSYVEYSPSGKGLHIITMGSFDGPGFNRMVNGRKIEMYQTARYFTFTGIPYGKFKEVTPHPEDVAILYRWLLDKSKKPEEPKQETKPARAPVSLEDEKIIKLASEAKNGAKFVRLYAGDMSDYENDHSRADQALCHILTFYTKDAAQIDRIFRSSGLYRKKWDRPDYSGKTISNALAQVNEQYTRPWTGRIYSGSAVVSRPGENGDTTLPCTEMGNGVRLARTFGNDIRFCEETGKWLTWEGTRWEMGGEVGMEARAKQIPKLILNEILQLADKKKQQETLSWYNKSQRLAQIKAMIQLARSEPGIGITVKELDSDPLLLNVLNGTLDLRTGTLHPHRREDYITKSAPVTFDPEAKASVFEETLQTVFNGDRGMIEFLQDAIGYSLSGDTGEQCIFVCYGTGANGKSTLLEVIQRLLGGYTTSLPMQSLMVKHFDGGGVPNDIAMLRGARFVTSVEADEGKRLSESLVKQLTGGDTISARFMRGEFFQFIPQFKLWLAVNHKPTITGTDEGIWRRIKLIPFEVVIPKEERDRKLSQKLRDELSGILNWALAGCQRWQRRGCLLFPEKVELATADYRREMDRLSDFIAERLLVGESFRSQSSILYQAYKKWCEQENVRALDSKKFKMAMIEKGFDYRLTHGKVQVIGLTVQAETSISSSVIRVG